MCYTEAMNITLQTSGLFSTNSYLIKDGDSVYLIDAPDRNSGMLELLKKEVSLTAVLLTHGHFDHIMGISEVLSLFPSVPVYLDEEDNFLIEENRNFLSFFCIPQSYYTVPSDIVLTPYGDTIGPFSVMKTPGHTPGSVSLYDEKDGVLFSGDTLFQSGEGRTDLGGNYSTLHKSLSLLLELPEKTVVYPGHGESTTVRAERFFTYRF